MTKHLGTFVSGLLFMAIGIAYVLQGLDVWEVKPARAWPVALIIIGAAVLFTSRGPRGDDEDDDEPNLWDDSQFS